MSERQQVKSPDELKPGDRVEMLSMSGSHPMVIDLLYRNQRGIWLGLMVDVDAKAFSAFDGEALEPGRRVGIAPDAYPAGDVFIRRRSREDDQVARCREVSHG